MEIAEEIRSCPETGARRLVAEYGDRLYDVAFRLSRDETAASDLVSRTLCRAIERIGLFSGASSMYTWLYAILVNFWRMDLRHVKRDRLLFPEELPDRPDEHPGPDELLAAKADSVAIRDAVAQLPDHFRAVVVFRYFEDMSVPEIARVLEIPEGTVKFRLHKAKKIMRCVLSQTVEERPASKGEGGR